MAHCIEVFYGMDESRFTLSRDITQVALGLILQDARRALENPEDLTARFSLGLAALTAAKSPQLEMKLKNMPIPLNASMVDEYVGSVLEAAKVGDLALVRQIERCV